MIDRHAHASPEVVIVGGGIAGVEALMALHDLGEGRLGVHLVSEHPTFVLRPQILGTPWGGHPLHIDLEALCSAFGARLSVANVSGVDAHLHELTTTGGATIGYDRLLLAPGAQLGMPYAVTPTLGFGELTPVLASSLAGSVAIVVPPGASWTLPAYELALHAAVDGRDVRVVSYEAHPMEAFGPGTAEPIAALLARRGVTVESSRALHPDEPAGELADTVVALPQLHGPAITGLALDRNGFVRVDERMRVAHATLVHAAGDATDTPIKQGGLAAQQAETACAEIVRSCGIEAPDAPYAPVLRGKLTAPGGEELFLRRALDGADPGVAADTPLWQPAGAVCAWRLARWVDHAPAVA